MPISLQIVGPSATDSLIPLLLAADEGEERIRATLANHVYTSYAALDDDHLVGAATVHWQDNESEIEYIAVSSSLRGRGYGKCIIAELLTEARRRNLSSLLVGTANSSLENIAFYQKCGFRMDHIRKDHFSYIQPPVIDNGMIIIDMIVFRYTL